MVVPLVVYEVAMNNYPDERNASVIFILFYCWFLVTAQA